MSRFQQNRAAVDGDVVKRLKQGDRKAQERVYRAFSKTVYTTARRMLGDDQLAEEVTQDTFVDVMAKAKSLKQDAAFAGWVRSIAVNHCLMRLRSPWIKRRESMRPAEVPDAGSEHIERLLDIGQALDRLPAETRMVVWMHDVEGYTHHEIGRLFGRTASYSKSQLARGYQRLGEYRYGGPNESTKNHEQRQENERVQGSCAPV